MKAKKNLALVAAGIVIGAFLAFPTAHAAEELFTAVRSSHQSSWMGKKFRWKHISSTATTMSSSGTSERRWASTSIGRTESGR